MYIVTVDDVSNHFVTDESQHPPHASMSLDIRRLVASVVAAAAGAANDPMHYFERTDMPSRAQFVADVVVYSWTS